MISPDQGVSALAENHNRVKLINPVMSGFLLFAA
jgi:hypothetical protein